VDDIHIAYSETVTCISVMGEQEPLQELLGELNVLTEGAVQAHLFENMYAEGAYWLTLHDSQATKANGVRSMLRAAGLEGARTVVFGDHHNDLEMFQMADTAVAMANAVDELKQIASYIIGSNLEDNVVREIQRMEEKIKRLGC